jgi:adenosylcobinamide kinase/adenosylcobinamide-phosphate guanylyltransferase
MEERIARHRARREEHWRNVEEPRDLIGALSRITRDEVVLIDCATLWLTNQMLAHARLADEETRLIEALAAAPAPVVVVTNEVGSGIVPDNAQARAFREAQGRLNQRLAAAAGLVVLVAAGLPLVLKGTLPGGGA